MAFDAAVAATPAIDHFCSASPWVLGVQHGLGHGTVLDVRRSDAGYCALAREPTQADTLAPPDRMWMFSCPIIGPDPGLVTADMVRWLSAEPTWSMLLISGIPADVLQATSAAEPDTATAETSDAAPPLRPWSDSEAWVRGLAQLSTLGDLRLAPSTDRLLIDLSSGHEAWLERRSRKFRANLRNATRRASETGIELLDAHHLDREEMVRRLIDVEARSWKAEHQTGLNATDMLAMYDTLLARLQPGRARFWLARADNIDVGYILGAIDHSHPNRYRGLQQSFDKRFATAGIGSRLADHQLDCLGREAVTSVDLGMPIDYKSRWADHLRRTITLAVIRQ